MVYSLLILCALFTAPAFADLSESRRTAIVTAVEAVLPATVTIGAEKVAVQQVNPFRSLHDDFFSDWFSDPFFGGYRRAVRVKSLGSGILVDRRGLILTNDHVVAGAEEIHVTLSDGRAFQARVKGRGLPLDLALLEIMPPKGHPPDEELDLPFVTPGASDDLALGEWAVAIGAPSNLEASVTAGIISAVGRRLPAKQDYKYLGMIQTDAAINPGNSGGPLVNADGKVVGINTVIISQSGGSEGLGFAIPAEQARKVIGDITEAGELRPAWFGWELAEDESAGRLVVRKVHSPSDAASAGIRPGAALVALNGKPTRSADDYDQMLLSIRIGQAVAARVQENSAERVVRLIGRAIPESLLRVDLGLVVQNVSSRYRRLGGSGVLVAEVRPDGIIARLKSAPIQPGDILVAVNEEAVDAVEAYDAVVRRLKKGATVEITVRRRNLLFSFSFSL